MRTVGCFTDGHGRAALAVSSGLTFAAEPGDCGCLDDRVDGVPILGYRAGFRVPSPLETPGLMSFATPSRPGAVPRRTGPRPPVGQPRTRTPSVGVRSCCPLLSPIGEAEGSRGDAARGCTRRGGSRAAGGLATTLVRACASRAEPGRLSARPGVLLMTSHVPTSDWHCGQAANCCHRQLRAADACLTAQVARHPRSRISDGMELVGPLHPPQALRARHGYWLAASWRLETRPGRCETRRLTCMGGGGIDGDRAGSASRCAGWSNSAASPC